MTMAEKLTTIAENEQKVYDAGKQAFYAFFWDEFQQNGELTNYVGAFGGQWTPDTFKPKYPIRPTYANFMFYNNLSQALVIEDFVEFCKENNVVLDFSNCIASQYGLACLWTEHFGVLDFSKSTNIISLFYSHNNNSGVKKIDEFISSEKTKFNTEASTNGTFHMATQLTDITMSGVVACSINFGTCPLNKASIESVVNVLSSTVSGQTVTFKKTAVNEAFSDAEWQELIATIPAGWSVALV